MKDYQHIIVYFLVGFALGWIWGYTSALDTFAGKAIDFLNLNLTRQDVLIAMGKMR